LTFWGCIEGKSLILTDEPVAPLEKNMDTSLAWLNNFYLASTKKGIVLMEAVDEAIRRIGKRESLTRI